MSTVFNFTFVPWFRSVAPYIHKFRNQTFVVGVPGGCLDPRRNLQRLIPQHRQHLLVSDLPQLLVAEPRSDRGHPILQLCDRVLHQHHDRDLTHDHFA